MTLPISRKPGTIMPRRAAWLAVLGSRTRLAVLAVALALGGSGCGRGVRAGTAFSAGGVSVGSPPIRPGAALGWLYLYLDDTSTSALMLDSVRLSGPGIGTVARAVEIKVAPLRSGYHHYHVLDGTPGGTYMTDPPVSLGGKGCHKQHLFPVHGHRLTPGSQVRIYIVLQAVRPGRYSLRSPVVYYTQHGIRYRQAIPYRFWGSVADHAPSLRMDPLEAVCVRPSGARMLSGWRLPKDMKKLQNLLK